MNNVIEVLFPWLNADRRVRPPCRIGSACQEGVRRVLLAGALLFGPQLTQAAVPLASSGTCMLTQITSSPSARSILPSINADGTRIAFESRANLTGNNVDGNSEIFFVDATTNMLTQVTNTVRPVGIKVGNSGEASINADGTRIAFSSDADPTGGNADGNVEIYLFDSVASGLTQVTDSTGPDDSLRPSISDDGTRIAFISANDLTGDNADGGFELFLFNGSTSAISQLTDSPLSATYNSPSTNANGTRIAFSSYSDLTGNNADGSSEIFLFDTNTSDLNQITDLNDSHASGPRINDDGTRIAFVSSANITGDNPGGDLQVLLFDTGSNTFTQITDSGLGGRERLSGSFDASINSNGDRVAFRSDRDLAGGNADGNWEIMLFDASIDTFTQVTDSRRLGATFGPSINANGTRVAFNSRADLTGNNPDGNPEIFRADCGLPGGPVMCGGFEATMVGTAANNTLNGTPFADVIQGGGGNDVIRGLGGNDVICGSVGNDRVFGNDGRDLLFGGVGNDQLSGGSGKDALGGGGNVDRCDGGAPASGDTANNCEQTVNVP